jgi:polysaccharide pyruvyl transferase WcaK-like protein
MKRVTITGYYGFKNFGDDLFPLGIAKLFKDHNKIELSILSPEISGVCAKYLVPSRLSSLYKQKTIVGKSIRLVMMLYAAIYSDHIILAGGSVISSNSSNAMRKFQYIIAKMGICSFSAAGVSVGPFNNPIDYTNAKKFINELKFILVRDQESYDLVSTMGFQHKLEMSLDIAGIINYADYLDAHKERNGEVAVALCNYESYVNGDLMKESKRIENVTSAFIKFCEDNYIKTVKVLVLNSNKSDGDMSLAESFSTRLSNSNIAHEFYIHKNPEETIDEINNSKLILSMRLHGAIVAYLGCTPFVLVEYHKKCHEFNSLVLNDSELVDTEDADALTTHLSKVYASGNSLKLLPSEYSRICYNKFFSALNKL